MVLRDRNGRPPPWGHSRRAQSETKNLAISTSNFPPHATPCPTTLACGTAAWPHRTPKRPLSSGSILPGRCPGQISSSPFRSTRLKEQPRPRPNHTPTPPLKHDCVPPPLVLTYGGGWGAGRHHLATPHHNVPHPIPEPSLASRGEATSFHAHI